MTASFGRERGEILAYVVPILVACIALQTWFVPGKVIASGDLSPPVPPGTEYRSHWNHLATGEGGPSYTIINAAYYEPLRAAMWLGIGEDMFQRLWLTALVALAVGGTVFFVFALTANPVIPGIAAVLALFNPYRLVTGHEPVSLATLALATLLGGLVLRAALQRRSSRGLLSFAVASLGLSFIFNNPAHVILVAIWVVASVALSWALGGTASGRAAAVFLAKATPLVLVLNAWWMVPLGLTILSPAFESQFAAAGVQEWAWTHDRASLLNVVTLNSSWVTAFPEYSPFEDRLARAPFDALRYFLPTLAVLGVVLSHGRQRAVALGVAVFAAVFIWMAKGLHAPLGGVNRWFYDNVPGYWLFREPFKALILLGLAFGILAAIGLVRLTSVRLGSAPVGATLAGMLLAGALVYVYPLFTGAVIPDDRPLLPSAHVRVPDGWQDAMRYLRAAPTEGKVVVLPRQDFYAVRTTWAYYGPPFIRYAVDRAFLEELPGGYYSSAPSVSRLLESIESDLHSRRVATIAPKLRALGATYVLLRRDLRDFPGRRLVKADVLANGLSRVPGLQLVRSFGIADVYALDSDGAELLPAVPVHTDAGPPASVPEILELEPSAAVMPPTSARGEGSPAIAASEVRLFEGTWRVAVRRFEGQIMVRLSTAAAGGRGESAGRQSRSYVRLPDVRGRFLLVAGSDAFTVPRVSTRWTWVGRLRGEGTTAVSAVKFRVGGAGSGRLPHVSYERVGPAEFHVRVSRAEAPFVLVAAETFAPGWRVQSTAGDARGLRHLRVNGYSNGWIVPWGGSYELRVVYQPEQIAALARSTGLVVVPVAVLLWLGSILVPRRWRSFEPRVRDAFVRRLRHARSRLKRTGETLFIRDSNAD